MSRWWSRSRDRIGRARWWWWYAAPPSAIWMWHFKRGHADWLMSHYLRWCKREPIAYRPEFDHPVKARRARHRVGSIISLMVGCFSSLLFTTTIATVTDLALVGTLDDVWYVFVGWVFGAWATFGIWLFFIRESE